MALKVKDAIVDRLRDKLGARPDVDTRNPDVRVVAHLARGEAVPVAGPVRRAAVPPRLPRAPHPRAAQGDAGRRPAARRGLHRRGAARRPDVRLGHAASSRAASSPAGAPRASAARFAVERWPHLGARAKEMLADLRADARAQRAQGARPHPRLRQRPEALEAARRQREGGEARARRSSSPRATPPSPAPSPRAAASSSPTRPTASASARGGQKGMKTFYFKLGENLRALHGLARLRARRQPGLRERLPRAALEPARRVERPHRLHAAGLPLRLAAAATRGSAQSRRSVCRSSRRMLLRCVQSMQDEEEPREQRRTRAARAVKNAVATADHAPRSASRRELTRAPRPTPARRRPRRRAPPGHQHHQHPERGGHALAALEASATPGSTWPRNAASPTAACTRGLSGHHPQGEHHRQRALERVQQQHHRRPASCPPPAPRWWRRCCRCRSARTSTPRSQRVSSTPKGTEPAR